MNGPGADEGDLERLSRENAELRAALAERDGPTRPSSSARRRVLASLVLLILGTAMLPTAVVTIWTRNQVLDTDRFVQTVAPLADDPAIEDAVAMRIADTVSAQLDVRSLAEDALPDDAGFLAAPIAAGADTLIGRASDEIVRSDAFDQVWVEANRIGHAALVAALTGRSGELLSSTDGRVELDLGALAQNVLEEIDQLLGLDVASRVPTDALDVRFVLVDSAQLADVQATVRWLDRLAWASVVLAVGLLAGSIALRPDRRRATLLVGAGIALSMLLLHVGFAVGRELYLNNLPPEVERPDAAVAIYDILTRLVQQSLRVVFVVGLVVLAGAWLAGPSRAASTARCVWNRLLGRSSDAAGSVLDLGPVPGWVARHTGALRAFVLAAAALTLLAWTQPTGTVVLVLAVIALAAIGAIQLVAGMDRTARRYQEAVPEDQREPADR